MDYTLKTGKRSFDSNDGPDAFTTLTEIPAGTQIEIVGKESHGSNPWTRWTGRTLEPFGEGAHRRTRILPGLVEGRDF